jgi:hypothetical protein
LVPDPEEKPDFESADTKFDSDGNREDFFETTGDRFDKHNYKPFQKTEKTFYNLFAALHM